MAGVVVMVCLGWWCEDVYRPSPRPPPPSSTSGYDSWEWADAELTPQGRDQCEDLRQKYVLTVPHGPQYHNGSCCRGQVVVMAISHEELCAPLLLDGAG